MSAIRKYYLIHIDKKGISKKIGAEYKNASMRYWQNFEKPLIKKDTPKAKIIIKGSKPDTTLVDSVLVLNPDGTKDYIVAHTKYQQMLKENKFKFK